MFEDREGSIFPHPLSAWWVPILLVVGWVPLFVAYAVYCALHTDGWGFVDFLARWEMFVTLPFTALGATSTLVQAFRLVAYFLNRPRALANASPSARSTRVLPR